jgi:hypothetical protein
LTCFTTHARYRASESIRWTPSRLKPYLYRGLFQCGECGCTITTETQKGHNYLRCTKRVSPCTQKYVREEAIASQVDRTIAKVVLEAEIADLMVSELAQEQATAAKTHEATVAKLRADLDACERQIDRLLDMRLSDQISETEYVPKKYTLVNRKAELRGKLEAIEANRRNRFEPAIRFVLEAKSLANLLAEGNPDKNRDFLQKTGSNFQVAGQALTVTFRTHWQLVADFNSDPTPTSAREREIWKIQNWRRGGDSNPRYLAVYALSKRAHSTTLPPLRSAKGVQPNRPLPARSMEIRPPAAGFGGAPASSLLIRRITRAARAPFFAKCRLPAAKPGR